MKKVLPLLIIGGLLIFASIIFADGSILANDQDGGSGSEAAYEPVAAMTVSATEVSWAPNGKSAGLVLSISGPDGLYMSQNVQDGVDLSLAIQDADGNVLPDGSYSYSLYMVPEAGAESQALSNVRNSGEAVSSTGNETQSGSFSVNGGAFVTAVASAGNNSTDSGNQLNDNVILDDLIVQQSACVGQDCANGESFGFDTIRLKENNLRIHFDDTSSSASFPSNDWRLKANDTSNGGANYFAIEDSTAGRNIFRVDAGAPANALRVNSTGNVGVGEDNPIVELHVTDGDSPSIRLEQDGSNGFTPQTWDLAGNESNFFVRDVTNGSQLPFKILPGADNNALVIAANNNIGLGTKSPLASLHIKEGGILLDSTVGDARIEIEENSTTTAARTLLKLTNKGPTRLEFIDTSTNISWQVGIDSNGFFEINANGGNAEFFFDSAGNFYLDGTTTTFGLGGETTMTYQTQQEKQQVRINQLEERIAELEALIEAMSAQE